MNQFTHFERVAKEILKEEALKNVEIVIVGVDRECDSMLKDACLLTAKGEIEPVSWATYENADLSDSAEISLSDDGDAVVVFHLTRPSGREHRSNGIQVLYDELDVPCVVFINVGKAALTLDGDWIEPGKYVMICERDLNDPDVQAFFQ